MGNLFLFLTITMKLLALFAAVVMATEDADAEAKTYEVKWLAKVCTDGAENAWTKADAGTDEAKCKTACAVDKVLACKFTAEVAATTDPVADAVPAVCETGTKAATEAEGAADATDAVKCGNVTEAAAAEAST